MERGLRPRSEREKPIERRGEECMKVRRMNAGSPELALQALVEYCVACDAGRRMSRNISRQSTKHEKEGQFRGHNEWRVIDYEGKARSSCSRSSQESHASPSKSASNHSTSKETLCHRPDTSSLRRWWTLDILDSSGRLVDDHPI